MGIVGRNIQYVAVGLFKLDLQETEHDIDTGSDTTSDNSDTDMSDSDNC